jgi:transcriptional regulator with XRE-family HTH domain
MTKSQRLRLALERLGWTMSILADQIGAGRSTTKAWCGGKTAPPDAVLAWLEGLAAHHVRHPPPPPRGPGRPPIQPV